ncbi:nitrogen fixation negative regulator NifL [Tolumonas osonensis]|uniref:Nitrogen fixation negative regulator NifL n=1 Tax=Tolumonas osonensis TaxID=675874 RepID=A0A841GK24_9GAMM|nr:nitrogen fixation negative regulator NifL [Tolumonas osonensis]MBB6055551.1 nitrogen fixation negative regulator NifL [Tolumonas osonensis]
MTILQNYTPETTGAVCINSASLQQMVSLLPMELFYGVVEQSSVGISITDPKANILYCNTAFCRLTGYKRGELQYRNHNILASKQTPKSRYQAMWHQLTQHQPWTGRLINKRKDGSLYLAEVTVTPVLNTDSQITHFLGMHRDISDQFALEQRVHNQKAMIEAVLDAAPTAIAVLNEFNQVVLDNLTYKTLRTDLRGIEPFLALEFTPGQQRPDRDLLWPLTIRGRQRWFSINIQPLFELNEEAGLYFGEGKRPCSLLMITDQTERRQQMEQSRLEQLRVQVEEQTLFSAIRETLDVAMIQTQAPLNMLQAALRLESDTDSRAAIAINTALQVGREAMKRLEQYRPAMKTEAPSHFGLVRLFGDLHDMQVLRLEHLDVLMQIDIATDLPRLFMQRTRLLTGLCLLFERACQAVTGQAAAQLKLCAYQNEQELCLEVHDSGTAPVITATHRLLQPHPTENGDKRNDTMELSFVQNIVNDHRGVIEVETSDLGGSCIRLRLPLCTIIREDKK